MTNRTLIKNAQIVSGQGLRHADILIEGQRIEAIQSNLAVAEDVQVINAQGQPVLPGLIDDQVHFREPGNTHKADMQSESRAALLGGITSVLEMPNTSPPTTTAAALEEKFAIAASKMATNYGFYLGATPDNIEEIERADQMGACGVKVFMGASTGSLLVDQRADLERIFSRCPILIATHCEHGPTMAANLARYADPEAIAISEHPRIRDAEACFQSSSLAVELAKKHGARLHVLHISTERELSLFEAGDRMKKRITAEVCVHHLYFCDEDYERLGARIKWNPAIKCKEDRAALRRAVFEDRIDVIATDHAPHLLSEKDSPYPSCPSGAPLVQHALPALLELSSQGGFAMQTIVEKFCHAPADIYGIVDRGYIREGAFADLVMLRLASPWTVGPENVAYRCGWSPFDGHTFPSRIENVWRGGEMVVQNGKLCSESSGARLEFQR